MAETQGSPDLRYQGADPDKGKVRPASEGLSSDTSAEKTNICVSNYWDYHGAT